MNIFVLSLGFLFYCCYLWSVTLGQTEQVGLCAKDISLKMIRFRYCIWNALSNTGVQKHFFLYGSFWFLIYSGIFSIDIRCLKSSFTKNLSKITELPISHRFMQENGSRKKPSCYLQYKTMHTSKAKSFQSPLKYCYKFPIYYAVA